MTAQPLPVPGERYKRDGLTREVVETEPAFSFVRLASVTYRIRYGSQDEQHTVSVGNWNRWARGAEKVSA